MELSEAVFEAYGLTASDFDCNRISNGHIHQTFHLKNKTSSNDLVLQTINTHVFRQPEIIGRNIRLAASYLKEKHPAYLFLNPVQTIKGTEMHVTHGLYWRLTPFIHNAIAPDKAENTTQAYEAAKQFGKLCRLLDGCNIQNFAPSIPSFHDLDFRFKQFKNDLKQASAVRLKSAAYLIKELSNLESIVNTYNEVKNSPDFPTRIVHHDTKISNVLLKEATYEGLCVIDLDTLMPGKIISDLGDMIRTYLCTVTEEETDFDKIKIREDYYEALMKGYLSEMANELTATEKELLIFSGKFIIYMQAIRFLGDYLGNNRYYPIQYPEHNLNRAKNQLVLLNQFTANETRLKSILSACLNHKDN